MVIFAWILLILAVILLVAKLVNDYTLDVGCIAIAIFMTLYLFGVGN